MKMAASEGTLPSPLKRPTIIRQTQPKDNGSPHAPARPAPPVPGRPAKPSNDKSESAMMPPRPAGKTPPRPASIAAPLTQPPAKQSHDSCVKKRPKITIVSAKPMVEVGFRDQKAVDNPSSHIDSAIVESNNRSPSSGNTASQPPPPPPPRPELRESKPDEPNKSLESIVSDVGSNLRQPPPLVPRNSVKRPTIIKPVPDQNNDDDRELIVTKSLPKPPQRPPVSVKQPGSSLADNKPVRPDKPSPPIVQPRPNANTNTNNFSIENPKQETVEDPTPIYAVIDKPKKPTIIRPGRPSVKDNLDTKQETGAINNPGCDQNIDSKTEETRDDNIPEFLRKKLKTTVNEGDTNKVASMVTGPPIKPRPSPPQKPQIGAKPTPAVKPTVSAKPVINSAISNSNSDTLKDQTEAKLIDLETPSEYGNPKPLPVRKPTIIRPSKPVHVESVVGDEPVKTNETSESEKENPPRPKPPPAKPAPAKRPSSVANSNVPDSEMHINDLESVLRRQKNKNSHSTGMSSDSSDTSHLSPKPSPRQATRSRPMSMFVPLVSRPPLPKHSLTTDDTNKISQPSHDSHSAPPRPLSKPPSRTQTSPREASSESVDAPEKPHRMSVHKIGVSVFPQLKPTTQDKSKPDTKPEPIKLAHEIPSPPSHPVKPASHTELEDTDSSQDDDFVMAKDRPDRPAVGPRRASNEETVKPTRPTAPQPSRPSPKPQQTHTDNTPGGGSVKARPPRPEGKPQRPMSIPVKEVSPQKPAPPKVSRGKQDREPNLPKRPKPGHPLYHYMMTTAHGVATHDYTAQVEDELSFKAGDAVVLVKRIDEQWLVGRNGSSEGMFPASFIQIKVPLPGECCEELESDSSDEEMFYDTSSDKPDILGAGPRCRARFDFDGEGPEDLMFEEGDVIRLVERVGPEWRRGEIQGRTGLFPLAFVETIEDLPEVGAESQSSHIALSVFDFDGESGDLSFKAGEEITVLHAVNEEWLFGEIGRSRRGQFPVQFIDHVPHNLEVLGQQSDSGKAGVGGHMHSGSGDKISESLAMWGDDSDTKQDEVDKPAQLPNTTTSRHDITNSDNSISTDTHETGVHHTPSNLSTPIIPPTSHPLSSNVPVKYCIAMYDFTSETGGDLSFTTGERIQVIERIGDDWVKGKIGEQTGMFPAAFVEFETVSSTEHSSSPVHWSNSSEDPSNHTSPLSHSEIIVTALYDFHGEADNELTFVTGDQINIEGAVEGAEDWSWGHLHGHRGMFPTAFVQL